MKTTENSMEKIKAVYCCTVCYVQQLLNAFYRMYGQTTPTHQGHLYTKHLTRQILTSLTGITHTPRASSWAQENPTYRRLMPQVDTGTSPCKICLRVKVIRILQNRNTVVFPYQKGRDQHQYFVLLQRDVVSFCIFKCQIRPVCQIMVLQQ